MASLAKQKLEVEEASLLAKKTAMEAELRSLEKQKQVAEEGAREARERGAVEVEELYARKTRLEAEAAGVVEQQRGAAAAAAELALVLEEHKRLVAVAERETAEAQAQEAIMQVRVVVVL